MGSQVVGINRWRLQSRRAVGKIRGRSGASNGAIDRIDLFRIKIGRER